MVKEEGVEFVKEWEKPDPNEIAVNNGLNKLLTGLQANRDKASAFAEKPIPGRWVASLPSSLSIKISKTSSSKGFSSLERATTLLFGPRAAIFFLSRTVKPIPAALP